MEVDITLLDEKKVALYKMIKKEEVAG